MGRPVDPTAQFVIKAHCTHGYTYASTQPWQIDQETGKKKYSYKHWGTVDEKMKFIPGTGYRLASPEDRAKLIFPEDWDLSEISTPLNQPSAKIQSNNHAYINKLYGDVWLLEQVATATNIRQDLEVVFKGNLELVDDIITLAIFPYITGFKYSRVVQWQRIFKAPSSRDLTPSYITRLTQSITEQHRMELLTLRATKLGDEEICAVDSTTRSAFGNSLADIRWGKNKENIKLQQTTEVVVYSLTSHEPVYYRTFPGNMPDCRTLDTILRDLRTAGFKDLVLVTDRGYETGNNLKNMVRLKQPFITCAKIGQAQIYKLISEIPKFETRPETMTIYSERDLYYSQHDMDYEIFEDGKLTKVDGLKINLFFNPYKRCSQLLAMDTAIATQKDSLEQLILNKTNRCDINRADFNYYKQKYDNANQYLKSFELNDKKASKEHMLAGFFSSISYGIDSDAVMALDTYSLRDEQEKYFQMMKDLMVADRQRNWSEDGKTGRLFILFISLTLSSYIRYMWKSTKLRTLFTTSLEILDEMRPIRYIKNDEGTTITPFIGRQTDICEAFGFKIPEGCQNSNTSYDKPKRKCGRPRKNVVEPHL